MAHTEPAGDKAKPRLQALAEKLTLHGFRAFPVRPDTRGPWWSGFSSSDAPYSLAYIRKRSEHWEQAAQVGVLVWPRLVVIDVDIKNGKLGALGLQRLEALLGPLPATARQWTPSGGWHLIFELSRPPEAGAFPPNFGLAYGGVAGGEHVDVLYRHHRYLTIYEPEALLGAEVAMLPPAWEEWLFTHAQPVPQPSKKAAKAHRRGGTSTTINDAMAALAETPEGNRRNTLRDLALRLVTGRVMTAALRQEVIDAARTCGLPHEEITRTIDGAEAYATKRWQDVTDWERDAVTWHGTSEYSRAKSLGQCIRVMAQTAVEVMAEEPFDGVPSRVLGMSSRDLAERCNISQRTAAQCLKRLVDAGWLNVVRSFSDSWADATRYRLAWPNAAQQSLNQRPSPRGLYMQDRDLRLSSPCATSTSFDEWGVGGGVLFGQQVAHLLRHPCFARSRGVNCTLPRGLAPMLVAMQEGSLSREQQIELVPNRNTRGHYRKVLESAGLIDFDAKTKVMAPTFQVAWHALDDYAAAMQIPDLVSERAQRHDAERVKYKRNFDAYGNWINQRQRPTEKRRRDGKGIHTRGKP